MMKTKVPTFTPGPWRVDCGFDPADGAFYINSSNHKRLAVLDTNSSIKDEANANLMALSPEMYEALNLLLVGAKAVQARGVVNPQLNGGIVLAEAVMKKLSSVSSTEGKDEQSS